jgi:glycosyltransferase involved in cell wall biosynthesis
LKVSVITVCYNAAPLIERTVGSVLAQTYPSLQYLVIDGASTDDTLRRLEPMRARIDVLRSEPDAGIYDAMNKAIRLADGECLLFMNAGDVFASQEALTQLVASMPPGPAGVVFGGWAVMRGEGRIEHRRPDLARGLFNHQATLYSRALHAAHGDYLCVPGVSAADFLFFRTLQAAGRTVFAECPHEVAQIDPHGVSAGLQTYLQRVLVDALCGYEGRYVAAAKMAIHPLYHRLKRLLRGGR